MERLIAALGLLLAACAAGFASSGCGAVAAAESAHATKVVVFHAYDARGHLAHGLTVAKRVKALCSASISTVRPDGWRCFSTSDTIYDPCFSTSLSAKQVVCPTDYFDRAVVVVTLTAPLERPTGEDAHVVKMLRPPDLEPWALALSDGATCVFLAGATFVVNGDRANYPCSKDGWVIGYPEEAKPGYWVVHLADPLGKKIARTRAVTTGIL